jgi:hypothetical protein
MSGRKLVLPPYHLIVGASMATPITSPTTTIQFTDNVGVQLNFTGTPTGTFSVNVSLDNINFIPLTLPQVPVASGTAGQIYIDLTQLSSPYIQITYSPISGTGTLDAFIGAKEI